MYQRCMRWTSPRSAARTPIWQVTLEETRIRVFTVAKPTLRNCVCSAHTSGFVERSVKYIAKSPAKNISSLESQMIVPTATLFGWVGWAPGCAEVTTVVEATRAVCQICPGVPTRTPVSRPACPALLPSADAGTK